MQDQPINESKVYAGPGWRAAEAGFTLALAPEQVSIILEGIGDGFLIFDRHWRYAYINQRAATLTHHSKEFLLGRNVWEIFPQSVGGVYYLELHRAMQERIATRVEDYLPAYDIWLETRVHPVDDGLALYISDITRQKQAEQALQRLNQELEQRVADRTRELRDINQQMESFCYTVSHDLRAPLRSLQGFSQALIEDCSEALSLPGREYARRIMKSAEHMDTLIQDVLAYTRLSRMEMALEPVDVEESIQCAAANLSDQARRSGAVIRVEKPFPTVAGHRSTMELMMANLISNAVKFVDSGVQPSVLIRAVDEGEFVRIWVEDNGLGIDPAYHQRIFRVFERLHGTDTYPGTGIGLALVAKGAERLGGSAGVESRLGQGSKFWLCLRKAA